MDRTNFNIRTQKKCKFFSKSMTNRGSLWYNTLGGKQLVLIREEIRT
ncbi:MAG: hypothetical protein IJW19_02740 [Clostridia bacterium]|nr:hypothetical protein [Clostridia bacterium]